MKMKMTNKPKFITLTLVVLFIASSCNFNHPSAMNENTPTRGKTKIGVEIEYIESMVGLSCLHSE